MSRVGSLQAPISPLKANESEVVTELRRRMDAQEAELIALRHELHTIRDRFAFPFPPDQSTLSTPSNQDLEHEGEDTMPTPRPPSNPHCVDIEPRSDSFDSEPSTPLFQRTIQSTLGEEEDRILHPGVFSDLGPTSPGGSPPPLFVVNPDLIGGQDRVKSEDTDKGQARGDDLESKGMVDELVTARDALRSALAAMEPVKTQLRFVEKELETRGSA
ncbi:hypothetical protein BDV93DRAFT_523399 [Ceratobasidium sp. AG-I]|nr:hypothetical protein BDV93DRAFT_523399 [Ceratobasidium sp. AG-I]